MSEKKKVLIVSQEMEPYTALSEISNIARKLPQYVQEKGMEIRVLMPRFGIEDNSDRTVFFCKGVIETVKKFGWAPDIVHCHGWMTSLIPFYLKTAYKTEPLFQNAKIVQSIYNNTLESTFTKQFITKATINDLEEGDLSAFFNDDNITLNNGAIMHSDAIIKGSEELSDDVLASIEASGNAVLEHQGEDYLAAYVEFYHSLLEQEEEVEG